MLVDSCDFHTMRSFGTACFAFGIKDDKVRETLLRESSLTLHKTDEICQVAESMVAQINIVSDTSETTSNAVKCGHSITSGTNLSNVNNKPLQECWN